MSYARKPDCLKDRWCLKEPLMTVLAIRSTKLKAVPNFSAVEARFFVGYIVTTS